MKILFLSDNFPPEVNAPATRTFEHCREWVQLGAEVTVITCAPNFPQGIVYKGYKNKLKQIETIEGIQVVRVWTYITANEGFFKRTLDYISFSVSAFLAGLFQDFDVIVATSPQFFTALSGRTLSKFKKKPWIMEVRDLWPESIKTVGAMKDNLFIRHFEKEEIWCYKHASCIITVTDSFKSEIIKKGIVSEKLFVVKNGANLDLYKPQPRDEMLIRQLGLEGKRILGYVGTHGMAHKLDFIIDCAKEIYKNDPSFHFLLIGDGAEKTNLLQKLAIEDVQNVTMLDSIGKQEVPSYLSILDAALINLKKSELFKTVIPSKIFESAAMQLPILIGVDGEARSIVESYNAGLFYEPENMSSFINELHNLFYTEGLYDYLKEGCSKLAVAFDRKRLAKEMFHIIHQTAKK
jgi:hypothetical protein